MDLQKKIEKLTEEGFIVVGDGEITVNGDAYISSSIEPVYGGGIQIDTFEFTFNRAGRRKSLTVRAVDILEWFGFRYGNMTLSLKLRKE